MSSNAPIRMYLFTSNAKTNSTTATKPTMFYGNPRALKLDLFGAMEVKASEDYKFAEDLLAVLGKASFGAGLVVKGGVVKVSIAKHS